MKLATTGGPLLPCATARKGLSALIFPWRDCYGIDSADYADIAQDYGFEDYDTDALVTTIPTTVSDLAVDADGRNGPVMPRGRTMTNIIDASDTSPLTVSDLTSGHSYSIVSSDSSDVTVDAVTQTSGYVFVSDGEDVALTWTADNVVLVDLTNVFGSGSEKDAAWCLANISYFEDTQSVEALTITSTSADGLTTDTTTVDVGPMRSVPSAYDYIDSDGNKVTVIKEHVLTEDDIELANLTTVDRAKAILSDGAINSSYSSIDECKCVDSADWVQIAGADSADSAGGWTGSGNGFYFFATQGTWATVADAKASLVGLTVRYILATPTTGTEGADNYIRMFPGGSLSITSATGVPCSSDWEVPVESGGAKDYTGKGNNYIFGAVAPVFDGVSIVFNGVDSSGTAGTYTYELWAWGTDGATCSWVEALPDTTAGYAYLGLLMDREPTDIEKAQLKAWGKRVLLSECGVTI
jgi:hypothetical protein